MSSPSSRTRPVIQPWPASSCIRFRVRRKVDLPQPDGPITAGTWLDPNARDTPLAAVNFPYRAVSLSVAMRGSGWTPPWSRLFPGFRRASSARLTAASAIEGESPPDGESGTQAEHEHHHDQHQ